MLTAGEGMQTWAGAVVVPLHGVVPAGLWPRLLDYRRAGCLTIVVNNNACPLNATDPGTSPGPGLEVLENQNRGGLAGGLNRGVARAIARGCGVITLLDQDSTLPVEGLLELQRLARSAPDRVVGPAIWDGERRRWHASAGRTRLLITSGTTVTAAAWTSVGPYREWMEIDYLDHEWCGRARAAGMILEVRGEAQLVQTFGRRHPSPLGHRIGLQLYSPYRRAIALRNLRWLLRQRYVPLDIRLKEALKMSIKPWCWLLLEPDRRVTVRALWLGLMTPPGEPFPRHRLKVARA